MLRHVLVLCLASAIGLFACSEPPPNLPISPPATAAPPPPPPPVDPATVTEGDTTLAYVNGMQVLVKHVPTAEVASIQLYIKGGIRDVAPNQAGITRLALATAVSGGTQSLDKSAFSRKLAALGSEIGADSRQDYAFIHAKALTQTWDDTLGLVADTFLKPLLPAQEMELQRQRQLISLHHEADDPDTALAVLSYKTDYAGHPFQHRPIGSLTTVPGLTAADIAAHLATMRETSRLLLVTVGNVDPAHAVERVRALFGGLPRGNYQEAPFPTVTFQQPNLVIEARKLETNYIRGDFRGPSIRDPEFPQAMVALSELSHRFFEEVRTKRNLSYAVSAHLGGTSVPIGNIYVTAVDPNTALKVMLDEVRRLQTNLVSDKELAGTKSVFLTEYLMGNESTDGQASMIAASQILGGDFRLARTLPDRIRGVTPEQVRAFATTYLKNLQMVVLGDPNKLDPALFKSL